MVKRYFTHNYKKCSFFIIAEKIKIKMVIDNVKVGFHKMGTWGEGNGGVEEEDTKREFR